MRVVVINLLFIFFMTLTAYGQEPTDCDPLPGGSGYWYRYQINDFYSSLNYISYGVIRSNNVAACETKFEYVIHAGMNDAPYDTMRIILNSCYPDSSKYTYYDRYEDFRWPEKQYFEGRIKKMDTIMVSHEGKNYVLTKYKVTLQDSQLVTLYMTDSLGLVKKYGSYRSMSADNTEIEWRRSKCPQADFINAFLRALYRRQDFHERYDFGPRSIRHEIIDKKKYRQLKRTYKEKGLL